MTTATEIEIPKGFRRDEKGNLVAEKNIRAIDKRRDRTVLKTMKKVLRLQKQLAEFAEAAPEEIDAFVEASYKDSKVIQGQRKSNMTLRSFDGSYQIKLSTGSKLEFSEKLSIARDLAFECAERWAESVPEMKGMVHAAFAADKEGKINTDLLLDLRKHKSTDPRWQEAMEILADSMSYRKTRRYIRFYKRNEKGEYEQLVLDFSRL